MRVGRPADEGLQVAEVAHAIATLGAEGEDGYGTSCHFVALAGEEGFFFHAYVGLARLECGGSQEAVVARLPFGYALSVFIEGHIFVLEGGG